MKKVISSSLIVFLTMLLSCSVVAQNHPSVEATIPNLTVTNFIGHPFGFIPTKVKTASKMLSLLKNADWPIDNDTNYGSRTIWIWSFNSVDPKYRTHEFKIPYTFYDEPITNMTAYFEDSVHLDSYSIMVSKYAKDWSVDDVSATSYKIIDDLEKAGFEFLKADEPSETTIISRVYEKGDVWVRVETSICTKSRKFDSYSIEVEVQL